jgi:6-phosphofructokinase 2
MGAMPRILTLTLNPALDVATAIDRVEPVHKMRCGAPSQHAGGGGINVARVLHRLGAEVLAIYPAGGAVGAALTALLQGEGVPTRVLPIAGETRESFSVHEASTGQDWRFVLPGPTLSPSESQACHEAVLAAWGEPSSGGGDAWVVASGGLPPGVGTAFYADLVRALRALGAHVVIDTQGPALAEALSAGVDVVKPSLRELRQHTGHALVDEASQVSAARALIDGGQARIVAVSLGEQGAMLVTEAGAWRAHALRVPVASTIGAGDSFVAGLVWGLAQGQAPEQAFALALATSAAALLSPGTALADPADVARLLPEVKVVAL